MFSICCTKTFINLYLAQTKLKQRNETKQARLSSFLLLSMGALFFTFESKTSIVSISYAEVNSSNLSGLEHSLWLSAHGHNQEKGMDSQGREREFSRSLSWAVRGSVRAATAGTVAPSHPLLKFGKLTIKLEMLLYKAEGQQFQYFLRWDCKNSFHQT